jgi:hypothetical protein
MFHDCGTPYRGANRVPWDGIITDYETVCEGLI